MGVAEDYFELTNLYGRYAELLNMGELDELAALFRHGKVTSPDGTTSREGSTEVRAMYAASVVFGEKVPDTLLVTTNIQLDIDGDSATGRAYYSALHDLDGAPKVVVAGRYHDRFRRIDGRWWFEERMMHVDLLGDLSTHLLQPIEDL